MYTPSPIALNMGVGFDVVLMGAVHITGQRILLVPPHEAYPMYFSQFFVFLFSQDQKN